jgi:hypothetical protein
VLENLASQFLQQIFSGDTFNGLICTFLGVIIPVTILLFFAGINTFFCGITFLPTDLTTFFALLYPFAT